MSFLRSFISGPGMCENCGVNQKFGGHEYCGKTCAAEGEKKKKARASGPGGRAGGPPGPGFRNGFPSTSASYASAAAGPNAGYDQSAYKTGNQQYGQGGPAAAPALTRVIAIDPNHPLAKSVYEKFCDRWDSDELPQPQVVAIYRIQLPVKFYSRFDNALELNEGATVLSSYYGGQQICEMGCKAEPEGALCNWESCSICLALRTAFSTLEFGEDVYDGIYGPGIYTHLSPAMAHRWTLAKNPEVTSCRAIIQCRVVRKQNADPGQPNSGYVDKTGRVFCKDKRALIPTHMIIYDPTIRPERRSTGRP